MRIVAAPVGERAALLVPEGAVATRSGLDFVQVAEACGGGERAVGLGAQAVDVARIHAAAADLFSPCALGAGLNARTIPELGAPIVCGAANNQLEVEDDGARLQARGIIYAPDYVVNAGGIISVSAEYIGESEAAVDARVRAIAPRLMKVLETAKVQNITPHQAADAIVRERLAAARKA